MVSHLEPTKTTLRGQESRIQTLKLHCPQLYDQVPTPESKALLLALSSGELRQISAPALTMLDSRHSTAVG